MANWNNPTTSSTYANYTTEINQKFEDLAVGLDPAITVVSGTIPQNTQRWVAASALWEKYVGTSWGPLASQYNINVLSATRWTTTRNITLQSDISGTTTIDGTGDITITATLPNVNANPGPVGSATAVPVITTNAKGQITAVTTAALGSIATQDSNNVLISGGAITGTALTLVSGLTPNPLVEGRMEWDNNDDVLMIGDGSAARIFVPTNPGSVYTETNRTFSTGCTWSGNTIVTSRGGTGVAGTLTGIPYANGATAWGTATAGDVVTLLGSTPVNNATAAVSATSAGKSTNLVGGNSTTLLGSIGYQSNTDVTTLLGPNTTTTRKFIRMTGTGVNGAAPVWDTVTKTDVGLSNVDNTSDATKNSATVTLTNKTLSTGCAAFSGFVFNQENAGTGEGGQFRLEKSTADAVTAGTGLMVDLLNGQLRIFEQGGSNRGAHLYIPDCTNGAVARILTNNILAKDVWSSYGYTINLTAGMMAWKNYANNHVIFDASAGTSPSGAAVNNTDSTSPWSASYPTLMGWNGTQTYGVRVDVCRRADSAVTADSATGVTTTVGAGATVNGYLVGYRNVPSSASSTIAATDSGKCLDATGSITIPNGVMSPGDVVSIFNNTAGNITLTASIATLYMAGTSNTGSRTLAQRGLATIRFLSSTVAVIGGSGLS